MICASTPSFNLLTLVDLEKDFEGSDHGLIEVLSQNLPGGTEENLNIVIASTEIRTERSLNTSQESYCNAVHLLLHIAL
jgi:hypothetical protein